MRITALVLLSGVVFFGLGFGIGWIQHRIRVLNGFLEVAKDDGVHDSVLHFMNAFTKRYL